MPRVIIENVLKHINKFYCLIDFNVIDTQPMQDPRKHTPAVLGHPFMATADGYISCRTENMQLSFGKMTMKLNIFNIPNEAQEDDEITEVDVIEVKVDDSFIFNYSDVLLKTYLTHFGFSFDVDSAISKLMLYFTRPLSWI